MEVYKGVRIYHSLARFCRKKVLKGELMCSSFFIEPKSEYNGINVYWLYKSKIALSDESENILYNRLNRDTLQSV